MLMLLTEGLCHLAGNLVSYFLPEMVLEGASELLTRYLRRLGA